MKKLLVLSSLVMSAYAMQASAAKTYELMIGYNQQGEIEVMYYQGAPEQNGVSQQYFDNEVGTLSSVNYQDGSVKCIKDYNAAGQPTQIQFDCNTTAVEASQYDVLGRLSRRSLTHSGNDWYTANLKGYNASGFLSGVDYSGLKLIDAESAQFNVNYGYNSQGQLISYQLGGERVDYQYDSQGNLLNHNAIGDMQPLDNAVLSDGYHRDDWIYDELGAFKGR